jgi:tetratricopeptide (TPR) repeat protein
MYTTLDELEALAQKSRQRQLKSTRRNWIVNAVLVLGSGVWLLYTWGRVSAEQKNLDALRGEVTRVVSERDRLQQERTTLTREIAALNSNKVELEKDAARLKQSLAEAGAEYARVLQNIEKAAESGSLDKVKQVVERERSSGSSLWQQGFATFQSGDKAAAAQLYEKAIESAPNDARAYNSLGRIKFEQGDLTGAERLYLEALKRDSRYAPALHNLSLLAFNRKDYPKARELNDKALKVLPGFKNARDLRAALDRVAPR